ncbi:MAG: peptidoglycan DD-metalloendopeptidase family protein, partial [Rhodoferax sp.]
MSALVSALLLGGAGATYAVGTMAPDLSLVPQHSVLQEVQPQALQAQAALLEAQSMRLYRSELLRSNDTAESLLKRLGLFDGQAAAFLRNDALVQQSLWGRSGRNVTVEAGDANTLLKLSARWSPEDNGLFKRLTVEKTATGYQSHVDTVPMMASSRLAGGSINSSLFAATDEARIPDSVAVQLAEIFSGDIDFHRSLRRGDRFSVVYETLEGDGEPLRAGRVLSAEFVNGGKSYQAMWFQDPLASSSSGTSQSTSKGGYYNLAGQSLRRAFLASPMEFSRVTSGFKMRMHPIFQTLRAHQGVDYGAPSGTPVRVVGDGVVHFAGAQGGYGNVVMVSHRNNYLTVYAHLSRILVRAGQSVGQGQNIGLVGQTGWATGPHLHFEYRINGAYRDPLTVARQSESIPVAASAKPTFEHAAAMVRAQLAAATQLQTSSAQ